MYIYIYIYIYIHVKTSLCARTEDVWLVFTCHVIITLTKWRKIYVIFLSVLLRVQSISCGFMYRVIELFGAKEVGSSQHLLRKVAMIRSFASSPFFTYLSPCTIIRTMARNFLFFSEVQDITPITRTYLLDKLRWFWCYKILTRSKVVFVNNLLPK